MLGLCSRLRKSPHALAFSPHLHRPSMLNLLVRPAPPRPTESLLSRFAVLSLALKDRGNGVKLLVRVLEALVEDVPSMRLVDLKGGDKHNAIPREAFATVLLPRGAVGDRLGDWFLGAGCRQFWRRRGCWGTRWVVFGVLFAAFG